MTRQYRVERDSKMSVNDIILLNVGGRKFETSRQTLLSDPQSMLAKMFDPESRMEPGVERDGAYFLDRDPHTFSIVLNYLRSGVLFADKPIELQAVLCEARYFSLLGLEELVMQKLGRARKIGTIGAGESPLGVKIKRWRENICDDQRDTLQVFQFKVSKPGGGEDTANF